MARTLWVLGLALLAALVIYGMRRGWLNRAGRQADLPARLPSPPQTLAEDEELLEAATGLYVGTTSARDWQDRIAAGDLGHRANASAHLYRSGMLLRRSGADPLWIPAESLRGVRLDHKLANKVVPGSGLLVMTWQVGEYRLDTGFRHADKESQDRWATTIEALVPTGTDAGTTKNETAATRQEET